MVRAVVEPDLAAALLAVDLDAALPRPASIDPPPRSPGDIRDGRPAPGRARRH